MSLEQEVAACTRAVVALTEALKVFTLRAPPSDAAPVTADRGEPAPAEVPGAPDPVQGEPAAAEAPALVDLDAAVVKLVTKKGRAATVALLAEFDATSTKTIAEGKRAAFMARAGEVLAA